MRVPDPDRRLSAQERLARRRVAAVLRSWRCPRFGATPLGLGVVESWSLDSAGGVAFAANVRLRFVADACALAAFASGLQHRLLALDLVAVSVEVAVDQPWRVTDVAEATRLELGLL